MKKHIWAVLCVLLAAALLAGCGGSQSEPASAASSEAPEPPAQSAEEPAKEPLDSDALMDIAMADVGVDFTECTNIKLRDSGDEVTVSFFYGGNDYAYIINRYTGEILDSSMAASDAAEPLDSDTLMDIALDDVGIDFTECSNLKVSKSGNEATITFTYGGYGYTYVLDRYTGEILDTSKAEVAGNGDAAGDADATTGEPLDSQQILDIALDACGQSMKGLDKVHIASKGGVSTVTFTLPSGDYCYVIDETTGEILDSQTP